MILALDQQVPTRETCERLKELGFPQEALWSWGLFGNVGSVLKRPPGLRLTEHLPRVHRVAAAPTVSELLEALEKQGWNVVELLVREESYCAEVLDMARSWTATAPNAAEALALLWIKVQETK